MAQTEHGRDDMLDVPKIEQMVDPTAAPEAPPLVPPEILAQTLGDYVGAQWMRIKSGDSGVLPVVLALVIIVVVFQVISPNHVFLTAGNLVNLFQQSAYLMIFAMAEIFAPLLACAAIGGAQGTLITRLRLPSFVVTLAGYLIFNGGLLIILALGPFSGYPSLTGRSFNLHALYNFMWGHVTPAVGWIAMIVVVALYGGGTFFRDQRRRSSGLVAPPVSLSLIRIAFFAGIGVAVVAICNVNRAAVGTLEGVPFAIFIVAGVLAMWVFLLHRTRFGRYMYAIGGNPEAARRAGINVAMIRTMAFVLCSMTGGIAGLLYASYLGGMSNNVNGGQLVLYAVAAAVIGGTSLFGGRGKISHGVLGGLVIGAIYNGMYLLGLAVQWQFIVTGAVLIFAVTIDALSRRNATA